MRRAFNGKVVDLVAPLVKNDFGVGVNQGLQCLRVLFFLPFLLPNRSCGCWSWADEYTGTCRESFFGNVAVNGSGGGVVRGLMGF